MPDDITLPDVLTELDARDSVPNVGDIVTMLPQPPATGLTEFRSFKVVARNFVYAYESAESARLGYCDVFLIVTDAADDELGVDFAE